MKKKVLVFPCGSEIGLEIYNSLRYSAHFEVFGGSSVDDHGMYVYTNYIGNIPSVDSPNFIEKINEIVKTNDIDFLIPAHDSVVLKFAQESDAGRLRCPVLTSPSETCAISRSKLKTYEKFKDILPTPKVFASSSVQLNDLPLFLKPDVGQGSKGTHLAKAIEDIAFYIKKEPSLLVLEYLPGKEYTVDCFTDKDGRLRFCEGRERIRVMNGISVNAVTVEDNRIGELAQKINSTLKLRGVWFFQVKENKGGDLILMEFAPRVAGTMALVRSKGVNLVLLSLFDAMGYEVDVFENSYEITIDRALDNKYRHNLDYQHVYLDFDDLVILGGKVNPAVMAFVYQCMNKKIKVHLLTRHREDLELSLRKYKLNGIFDELIWVKDGEEKHDYIKEKNAIFIDDSFAERKKVHQVNGIPVFDAHMIEALIEKF